MFLLPHGGNLRVFLWRSAENWSLLHIGLCLAGVDRRGAPFSLPRGRGCRSGLFSRSAGHPPGPSRPPEFRQLLSFSHLVSHRSFSHYASYHKCVTPSSRSVASPHRGGTHSFRCRGVSPPRAARLGGLSFRAPGVGGARVTRSIVRSFQHQNFKTRHDRDFDTFKCCPRPLQDFADTDFDAVSSPKFKLHRFKPRG